MKTLRHQRKKLKKKLQNRKDIHAPRLAECVNMAVLAKVNNLQIQMQSHKYILHRTSKDISKIHM